jgi:hypothetical protein
MRKRYTVSFLTHQTRKNIGQKRIYHVPEHHTPIVSPGEHARALLMLRANHASPFFNNKYEIRIIRRGLLAGFIPMNVAFGGYGAEHYLAAYIMARVPKITYSADVPVIPGLRHFGREVCCDKNTATLNVTKNLMSFNSMCVSRLDAKYVEILLNPSEKLIAVRKSSYKNKNAILWDSAVIAAREINSVFYEMMGWQKGWQCKIPANILRRDEQKVLIFDLSVCEFKYRTGGKNSRYVRAIPNNWANSEGTGKIDLMLNARRAYAQSLPDWRLAESALAVEGFDTYIEPYSSEAIDLTIRELMKNG